MQSSDLVELAALVSAEVPGLLRRKERFSAAGISAYWTASKCRFDRWARRLKRAHEGAAGRSNAAVAENRGCWATSSEILTSEILTRVWSAAVSAADRANGTSDLAPAAQSVLFGHQEVRRRVLNLIAIGRDRKERAAERLDRLRRVCERWTDLLLAPLSAFCDLKPLAHDVSRVADFSRDQHDERKATFSSRARQILHASLRATFRRAATAPSRNADLNSQIAAAIVACLDLERLDAAGVKLERPTYGWLF
ncbi:MAG TPA: hypothetical protein VKB78_07320, partial [Pirellulales bacterium]|nr:hypothetical protein [Pirellulales bacterium]